MSLFRQAAFYLSITALMVVLAGCGGYRDKGVNEDKDKPTPMVKQPNESDE